MARMIIHLSMLLLFCNSASAQQIFNKDSKMIVDFNAEGQIYFIHKLQYNQELVGLANLTNRPVKEIVQFNKLEKGRPVKIGANLKVPIDLDMILKGESLKAVKVSNHDYYIPVYYFVKKGDTAYKIAKTYCNDDVELLKKRNKLESTNLKLESQLLLGWFPIKNENTAAIAQLEKKQLPGRGNAPEIRKISESKVADNSNSNKALADNSKLELKSKAQKSTMLTNKSSIQNKVVEKNNLSLKIAEARLKDKRPIESKSSKDTIVKMFQVLEEDALRSKRGIAYWKKSHRTNFNKFVLYNNAPVNSVIELYNPMMKLSVKAKVIGKIPSETYHDDIDVVLSSGAANSLGAFDSRFMVEIKHR